jgi:hypothetical protein
MSNSQIQGNVSQLPASSPHLRDFCHCVTIPSIVAELLPIHKEAKMDQRT